MKNGLVEENGKLVYYKNDKLYHAGVIKVDGDIYYIDRHGCAVKGQHIVHGEMTNDILKRGTYTFGDDYKLKKGSYIKPKKKTRSSSRKKKHRMSKKTKKNLVIVSCFVVCFLLVLLFLTQLDFLRDISHSETKTSQSSGAKADIPTFDSEVLLCSERAKKLYDGELTEKEAITADSPYRAFVFEYTMPKESGTLILSESDSFTDPKEFTLEQDENSIVIDNLKTGTTYYYKVVVGEDVYNGSFDTAKSNRFIFFDGVINTRDIGGYETLHSKTVKQGLLIRGTELDGLVEAPYYLHDDQIDYIKREFGFVYDFDLRSNDVYAGKYKSRLGDDVRHKFYNSPAYGNIFSAENKKLVKDIFSDLAKESNYPMYLHCTYGADRTGTIVYLLQGILGVPEDKMDMEYMITAFSIPHIKENEYIDVLKTNLQGYEGDTINEKIETFLLDDIGVTEQEIDSIRGIFLE